MSYRPKTRLEKILNGQIMKARSGLEAAIQAALERTKPLEVDATMAADPETKLPTITINKYAGELYEAISKGKYVSVSASVEFDGVPVDACDTMAVSSKKLVVHGDETGTTTLYVFSFVLVDNEEGPEYYATEELGANDPVVFRHVTGE